MPTGYIVPPVPKVDPTATVVAVAEDSTLDITDFDKNITNTGSDGISPAITNVVLDLPPAAAVAGMPLHVQLTVAMTVTLKPQPGTGSPLEGTESIYLGGSGVAGKYLLIAGVIGNYVDLYSDGVQYLVTDYAGVVTKEA